MVIETTPVRPRLDPDSDDAIREQAYQIERGVRPMALLGTVKDDPGTMAAAHARIAALSGPTVIPFVIAVGNGRAHCGFAASRWVTDLYRWLYTISPASPEHIAMVTGLLLSYSVDAIRLYTDRRRGNPTVAHSE